MPTPDLFDWIVAGIDPPKEHDHDALRLVAAVMWSLALSTGLALVARGIGFAGNLDGEA